jgi:hypothetical protein
MTTLTITLQLPEEIHHRLEQVAQSTHQPLESVVFQTIQGNLPPSVEDAPADMRDELSALQDATDQSLWAIAKEPLPKEKWRRHQKLLHKNSSPGLKNAEREALGQLRSLTDRLVLRRSFALALLKWRGHTLPRTEQYGAL